MKKKFLSILILICLIIIYGCTENPVTKKKQLLLMSESQEKNIGEEQYPIYTQLANGIFQDNNLQDYVNNVGWKLAKKSHRPNLNYEFNVINQSELNAYALPGGKISITRGLIAKMDKEDELAGVLGHEIGHVAALHAAAGYTRMIITNVLLGVSNLYLEKRNIKNREIYMLAGALTSNLVLLKYNRDQERQADELGIEYMTDAGYNPKAFTQTMEILKSAYKKQPSKLENIFQSHPLTDERINTAKQAVETKYLEASKRPFKSKDFNIKIAYLQKVSPAYDYFDSAMILMNKKKDEDALALIDKAIKIAPRQAIFYTYEANILYEKEKFALAQEKLNKSKKLYPDLFFNRMLSGMVEYSQKEYDLAIKDLEKADYLVPEHIIVNYFLAKAYDEKNVKDKAIYYYKKVININPEGDMAKEAYKRIEQLTS